MCEVLVKSMLATVKLLLLITNGFSKRRWDIYRVPLVLAGKASLPMSLQMDHRLSAILPEPHVRIGPNSQHVHVGQGHDSAPESA